ncbi:MAG: hypothetical protein ACSLFQ_00470, partial [Thermoanaerobaculia bacterium]
MAAPRYALRWTIIGLVLIAILAASYVPYHLSAPFTHGGSPHGLIYGAVALFLIGLLLYYGIRKRNYKSRFGKVEEWLQSHIWLGILAFAVVVAHTGFRFEDTLAVALFIGVSAVVASGIFGAVLYRTVPRALTEVETNLSAEQISDQLNQLARSMARIASGKSEPFQRIYAGLAREAVPAPLAGWTLLLSSPGQRASREMTGDWTGLLGLVAPPEQDELRQLLV